MKMKIIFFFCLLATIRLSCAVDRQAILHAAVQEVKEYMDGIEEMAKSQAYRSSSITKSMKPYTASSQAIGKARIKLEKMVKVAERQLIQSEREEKINELDEKALAESYANEAFHKPGSLLTNEEIAYLSQESDCALLNTELNDGLINCSDDFRKQWRTASGICNNRVNFLLGAANTPMSRLIPAQYEDGISTPRGALQMEGNRLVPQPFAPPFPSARTVSTTIIRDEEMNDPIHTLMLMQWGQFMDHDLDTMPEFEHCPTDSCDITEMCAPILVSDVDQNVVRPIENRCHPFRRSLGVCGPESEFSTRENMNIISHFIDASTVYGHVQTIQDTVLRPSTSSIRLTTAQGPRGEMLPPADLVEHPHIVICMVEPCFLAGDARINEQPGLISIHTVFVREHNRIAEELSSQVNPFPPSEIFQQARAIVIAQIQKITYVDYLPKLLGTKTEELMSVYNYDSGIDPSIPNAFATAAFRFGHSQVQPFFEFVSRQGRVTNTFSLNDVFFKPKLVWDNGIEPVFRGMLRNPSRQLDEFINSVLTSHLFSSGPDVLGEDLASRNIQRGRDHGLPPYGDWKRWAKRVCKVESNFRSELTAVRFLEIYGNIENVDLFVGGLAEEPLSGGLLGATLGCIVAVTFRHVRDGDRFFYQNQKPEGNTETINSRLFTEPQIDEIEKTSLASIICLNARGDFGQIQKDAFLLPDESNNPVVDCSEIPRIDLSKFNTGAGEVEEPEVEEKEAQVEDDDRNLFAKLQDIVSKLEKKSMAKNADESNMNRNAEMQWGSWRRPYTSLPTTETATIPPNNVGTGVPSTMETNTVNEDRARKMSVLLNELLERMTRK